MRKLCLLLLLVLAVAAKAQNVSVEQDSTSMPDLRNDVFVILSTDSIWCDTCVYGEGVVLFKSIRKDAALPPEEGIYRSESYFQDTPYPHLRFCSYAVKSKSRGVDLGFTFILEVDSVTHEIRPLLSNTRIFTFPRDFLNKVTLLDMDKEFSLLKNKEESERLKKALKHKTIWVIDRKTMTDSIVTLVETDIPD